MPWKNAIAAGAVRARFVDVSEIANRKSFQAKMNDQDRGGEHARRGQRSDHLAERLERRGTVGLAACSSSHGISRKNADSTQIASGSVNVRYGMIRPGQVS